MALELILPENGSRYNISCCTAGVSQCYCNISNDSRWENFAPDSHPADMGPPLYMYIYVTIINAIVFLVGVIGNILVIQVVARTRSMHKRMNYFLVSLSVADLLVLVICQPIALLEFYGKEKWYMGEAMCKIVPFLENASHHCSVLTLLAIGFERYHAICYPLKQTVGGRMASTYIVIPAVWVLSCVVSVPFAFISHLKETVYYDESLVSVCRTDMSSTRWRAYIIFISVVFLALPLFLLTAMYAAIIMTLAASTMSPGEFRGNSHSIRASIRHSCSHDSDHVRNARAISSRRQVVRMMVCVMALYFLCLMPMRCVQLWMVFGDERDLENLGFIGYLNLINCVRILITVNSAGNPIIYGLLSSNFRAAFRHSFFNCRSNPRDQWRYNTTYYSNNHHHHYLYQQSQGSPSISNTHGRSPPDALQLGSKKANGGSKGGSQRNTPSPSPRRDRCDSAGSRGPFSSVREAMLVQNDDVTAQTEVTSPLFHSNGTKPTYV